MTVSFTASPSPSACVVIGVPLGLLMGMSRPIRAVLEPPIQAIRPIPKALLPFLIWFGIGNLSKSSSSVPWCCRRSPSRCRPRSIASRRSRPRRRWRQPGSFWRVVLRPACPAFHHIRVAISIGVTTVGRTHRDVGRIVDGFDRAEYLSTTVPLAC
jgi:hypothetical protein